MQKNKNWMGWLSEMPFDWPQEVRDNFLMVLDITGMKEARYRETDFYFEQLLPVPHVPETYELIRRLGVEAGGIIIDRDEQEAIDMKCDWLDSNKQSDSYTFISIGKNQDRKGLLDPKTMGHS